MLVGRIVAGLGVGCISVTVSTLWVGRYDLTVIPIGADICL